MSTQASVLYPTTMVQAAGTVYDCLAKNAIDSVLQSGETGDYRHSGSASGSPLTYFYESVTPHPGFAFEYVAVPIDNNCSCMSKVELEATVTNPNAQTKLPTFPDFITSAHLAVQLPAIIGEVDIANGTGGHVAAGTAGLTLEAMARAGVTGGQGSKVSTASENNLYPSVTANDECDAVNSSLSVSGSGVRFNQVSGQWEAHVATVTSYNLRQGVELQVGEQGLTAAEDAVSEFHDSLPIMVSVDTAVRDTQTDVVTFGPAEGADSKDLVAHVTNAEATASIDPEVVPPTIQFSTKKTSALSPGTGAFFGGGAQGLYDSTNLPVATVIDPGRRLVPGMKFAMTTTNTDTHNGSVSDGVATALADTSFVLNESAFHATENIPLSGPFGDLLWDCAPALAGKVDHVNNQGFNTKASGAEWMVGDIVAVTPATCDYGAPVFVRVMAVNFQGIGNKVVSWVTIEAPPQADNSNIGKVLSGSAAMPLILPGLDNATRPGGYGFKAGSCTAGADGSGSYSLGTAQERSGGSTDAINSAASNTNLQLSLIQAANSKVPGLNNGSLYSRQGTTFVAGNSPLGHMRVRHDAMFRRSYRCIPATEAWQDGVSFEPMDATADAGSTEWAVAGSKPVPRRAAIPMFEPSDLGSTNSAGSETRNPGRQGPFLANQIVYKESQPIAERVGPGAQVPNAAAAGTPSSNDIVYGNVSYASPSLSARGPLPLSASHYAHWVNGAAMRLVEKCNFYTGQTETNTMDQHDWVTMFAFEELMGAEGNRPHVLAGRGRRTRDELIRASQREQLIFVRLPFFFTLATSSSLEVIATNWADYMIKWNMAPHSRLIVKSNPSVKVYPAAPAATSDTRIAGQSQWDVRGGLTASSTRYSNVKRAGSAAAYTDTSKLPIHAYVVLGCVYLNQTMRAQVTEGFDEDQGYGVVDVAERQRQFKHALYLHPVTFMDGAMRDALVKDGDYPILKDIDGWSSEGNLTVAAIDKFVNDLKTDKVTGELISELDEAMQDIGIGGDRCAGPSGCGQFTARGDAHGHGGSGMYINQPMRSDQLYGSYQTGGVNALCGEAGEYTRAYIQTLRHLAVKGAGDQNIAITIVGSHPVIEFLLLFQVPDNAYANEWQNFTANVPPRFTLGSSQSLKGGVLQNYQESSNQEATTTSYPRGFSSIAESASQNSQGANQPRATLQDTRGPVKTVKVTANNNARISLAPGEQFCSLVPAVQHSQNPDLARGAYVYALPIALMPESNLEWSGSLNQGRLTNIKIELTFNDEAKNLALMCHVIQRCWNIEQTTAEGQGGAKYANVATISSGTV